MLLPRKKPCLKHNTQKSILMYTMANTRKTALNTHLHVSRLITPRSEVRARSRAPESGGGLQLRGWRLYKKKKSISLGIVMRSPNQTWSRGSRGCTDDTVPGR